MTAFKPFEWMSVGHQVTEKIPLPVRVEQVLGYLITSFLTQFELCNKISHLIKKILFYIYYGYDGYIK